MALRGVALDSYARMFLDKVARPDVDRVLNVRPAIAIEQKNQVRTARSTVGTTTEIADLLRLLFAKIGKPICPDCHEEARSFQPDTVTSDLLERFPEARPCCFSRDAAFRKVGIRLCAIAPDQWVHQTQNRGGNRRPSSRIQFLPPSSCRPLCVVLDRLVIREDNRSRLCEAIETAFREGDGRCAVEVIGQGLQPYHSGFCCQRCGRTFEPLRPILFSFNHPLGACPECKGFGNVLRYDPALVIPDHNKSLVQGAIEPWSKPGTDWWQKQMLLAMKRKGVDITALSSCLRRRKTLLWEGDKTFDGIDDFFHYLEGKRYKLHVRVLLSRYSTPFDCPGCHGQPAQA